MKNNFSACLVHLIFLTHLSIAGQAGVSDKTFDIYWIDMEGGGGTLMVTPLGESILVDTGMPGERDPGRIHAVATQVAGLKKIDHMVVTHFDIDHYGGAADISKLIPVGHVYDNGIPESTSNPAKNNQIPARLIQAYREFKADKRSIMQAGDTLKLAQLSAGPPIILRCLASKQQIVKPAVNQSDQNPLNSELIIKAKDTSQNANSIVLLLEYGPFRFFDGADLTWNIEGQLVCPINLVGVVDVFQVDHHGFDISNNTVLLRSLAPTISIMVNSPQKGCDPGTVATLKGLPSIKANYQLHRNLRPGATNTDPEFIANMEAKCSANYIKCTISPDGTSYTISIPGTKHQRAYLTRK